MWGGERWREVRWWGEVVLCSAKLVLCVVSNHPRLSSMFCPHAGDSKACKCKDCTYTVCWWLVFRMPQLICVSCATFFLSLFCFFACSLFPPLPYNLLLYWQTKIDKCTGKPVKKTGEGNVYPFIVLGWFSRVEMYIEFSTTKLHQHTHATHATHTHTHTHIHTYIHTYTHIQTHLLARCTPNWHMHTTRSPPQGGCRKPNWARDKYCDSEKQQRGLQLGRCVGPFSVYVSLPWNLFCLPAGSDQGNTRDSYLHVIFYNCPARTCASVHVFA